MKYRFMDKYRPMFRVTSMAYSVFREADSMAGSQDP